jgi:hypothetical protein
VRGFGRIWCDSSQVRNALGDIRTGEIMGGLTFQATESTLLINVPARQARVALFGNQRYIEG